MVKRRVFLVAVATCWLIVGNSALEANVLTQSDVGRVIALQGEVSKFNRNLGETTSAIARSRGVSGEIFCLMEVGDQATNINQYLFAATIVVELGAEMSEAGDEVKTLTAAANVVLPALLGAVDNARSEMNGIMGRCSRSRAAYDRAKSLEELTSKIKAVVAPLMARVQAKLPPGIGR